MAEQTDANDLAELARYLHENGYEAELGVRVTLHGAPVTLGPDGAPLPPPEHTP